MLSKADKLKMVKAARKSSVWFCEKVLQIQTLAWDKHREALEAMRNNKRVAIASGHSMGKDFLGGLIVLDFLFNNPSSIVITTAPTDRQVEKIIWGEISKYYRPELGGELLTKQIKIAPDWYAIGFTTKETNQMIGKFQGFKGKNILVLVTEAHAVEDSIYEQIEGILTAENSRLYLAGNPLRAEGYFFRAFSDPSFKTFTWSCYESPNYLAGKEVIPGMVGKAWVEDKEKRWGKDSPMFQARVEGIFPKHSTNTLLSLYEAREAVNATAVDGIKVLSIDPSRYGEDTTVFSFIQGGWVMKQVEHQGKPTTHTEGRALRYIELFHPDVVIVDEGTFGAGILDHLYEEAPRMKKQERYNFEILPFNFGGSPELSHFANKGTEVYYNVCERIKRVKDIQLPDNPELHNQLASRRYEYDSKGRLKLEDKAKHKKRGLPSPDNADSMIMGLYVSLGNKIKPDLENEDEKDFSYLEASFKSGYVEKEDSIHNV